jgi:hypothetical protein
LYPSPAVTGDVDIDGDTDVVVDVNVNVNVNVDVNVDVDGNGPYRPVSARYGPLPYMELKPDKNSSRHIACREL